MSGKDPKVAKKEGRRLRGEIACAECRRLKIKCDKKLPCTSCVGRGCSTLCPLGTVPPGDGTRFVSIAQDHLTKSLATLEERMHALEDALAILHSIDSPESVHPLLISPQGVGEPPYDAHEEKSTRTDKMFGATVDEALGALHIDQENRSNRYFGNTGGSESLLLRGTSDGNTDGGSDQALLEELDPSYLPEGINVSFKAFPFAPCIPPEPVQLDIESFLPSETRAISICENFFENLMWMAHIVSREDLFDHLIPAIYHKKEEYGPHDLSLFLITMAVGALLDLSLPAYNREAQHYYRLARAAMNLQPVLTEQSVATIKALHLMSIYMGISGKESNLEASYALLSFAAQIALNIGLHMDPSHWEITGSEAHSRRVYFWNLALAATWQALVTGRPPGILKELLECRIPTEADILSQPGNPLLGFGSWGFRSTSELLLPVARTVLSIKPPTYDAILDLDRTIRNFARPQPHLPQLSDSMATSMGNFARSHYQDLVLLFLHRGHFATACREFEDPMQSPYHQSVLAAYRSACRVVSDTMAQFEAKPTLCARIWRMWTYAFTSAVIVGTIAVRCQNIDIEPEPFERFEKTCILFREAAQTSSRAARALPILQNMYQKAHYASQARHRPREPKVKFEDEDLAIFGGKSHVVASRSPVEEEDGMLFTGKSRRTPSGSFNPFPVSQASQTLETSSGDSSHSGGLPSFHSPPPASSTERPAALSDWLHEPSIQPPPPPMDPSSGSVYADPAFHWEGLCPEQGMESGGSRGEPDAEWSAFLQTHGNVF